MNSTFDIGTELYHMLDSRFGYFAGIRYVHAYSSVILDEVDAFASNDHSRQEPITIHLIHCSRSGMPYRHELKA